MVALWKLTVHTRITLTYPTPPVDLKLKNVLSSSKYHIGCVKNGMPNCKFSVFQYIREALIYIKAKGDWS